MFAMQRLPSRSSSLNILCFGSAISIFISDVEKQASQPGFTDRIKVRRPQSSPIFVNDWQYGMILFLKNPEEEVTNDLVSVLGVPQEGGGGHQESGSRRHARRSQELLQVPLISLFYCNHAGNQCSGSARI